MADKDFVVKNGLVVNSTVLVANGTKVGVNTASPDAALTVVGSANVSGNVVLSGNSILVGVSSTDSQINVVANASFNSNVYFNERIYIGNNQNFVPLARPVMQAVDNFNGFVQLSSQNLANSTSGAENGGTDACSDMVVFGDDTNLGYDKFLDIGYNNSNFDGSLQYLWTSNAANLSIGSTLYQPITPSGNVAVGVLVSAVSINATTWNVVVSVANGGSFVETSGANGVLRNAGGNTVNILASNHRNYPFTIAKKNDGYLYVANGALSIGTSEGGRRANSSDPLYDASGNPLLFHTNGMLAENEVGRFVGNGNFVIGPNTTSRAAKLNVNGTANIAGQTNVGSNLNVAGNASVVGNVYGTSGVYTSSVNVGSASINTTHFAVGNSAQNAASFSVNGNSSVSTSVLRSGNLVIGNNSVTDSPLVQVQNSTSSSNLTPIGLTVGISTINASAISVGSNVVANATTITVGNSTVKAVLSQNSSAALQVTGNASVSANLSTANLIITAAVLGQANFAGNVAVAGNVNVSGNIYSPFSVISSAVNVGVVSISTTQALVGSNVTVDTAGLKITGNTSIPSMNIAGGNITVGNGSVSNTPTIQLTNSTATSNLTPGGLQAGIVSISGAGTINVGSNVWVTTSSIVVGNATTNLVVNTSSSQYQLSLQGNAIVNGDVRITANLIVNGTTTYAGTTEAAGNFIPTANLTYDIGTNAKYWNNLYIKNAIASPDGSVSVGNTTVNVAAYNDSVRVSNSTVFTNTSTAGVSVGNTTVNAQYGSAAARIGNSTSNSILSQTSLVIGNSSVSTTVNSSAFVGNVVATAISGNLTGNVAAITITGNLTGNVAATTISGNLTGNVAAITITGNLTGNVAATTISGNLTGNVVATTMNASTINATTVNAATFQVGSAFVANSTRVTTPSLTVLGNLQVTGTTTFVNTAVMDVTDVNITLAKGAANPAAADGGGITLEGANAIISYVAASNTWLSNISFTVGNSTSNVVVNSTALLGNTFGTHIGNVAAVSISGNLTGNVVATTISGNLTGNVAATTISGNLTGNVAATTISGNLTGNVSATTILASANVAVGAGVTNVYVNSTAFVGNVVATTISGNLTGNVAATLISGNLTGNVIATTISGNLTGNVAATTISGNLTGNVAATTISGNLTGNVVATTVNATSNVTVGANVFINTSAVSLSNSVARIFIDSSSFSVGNSVITSSPQIVVQNTAGVTVINSNFISTASISGNLSGNVAATTISGNLTGNVAATTISGNLTGNVAATTMSASANITVGGVSLVNSSTFAVGTGFTANSTVVNAVSYYVGTTLIANSTGPYGKTEANLNVNNATQLATSRNINGTAFNGTADITTSSWGTSRTITIGSSGKSVDGSAGVSWSLGEIGAAATNQTMYIGTTAVAINRASSSLSLTGVSIDGSAGSAGSATSAGTATNLSGGTAYATAVGVNVSVPATGYLSVQYDITAFASDKRLKTDVREIADALNKVKEIRGVTYRFNDTGKSFGFDDREHVGVIAQEVEAVLPQVIAPAPFDLDEDGESKSGENYKTVKYEKIVPLLIEAIKDLSDRVDQLNNRIIELEK